MIVLYITNGITGVGGLERVLAIKTAYLAEKYDYDVHVLSLNEQGKQPFYTFDPKINFHQILVQGNPLNYLLSYRSGIQKVINSVKPDVISVCDDGIKGLMFPLVFKFACPIIYERHVSKNIENAGNNSSNKSLITRCKYSLMNYGAKKFDKFVVLTNGSLNEWKLKNTIVIPNALPFYPENSSKLTNKKVIAVGKHGIQKGFDLLLQAWKMVTAVHPDWKLDIYGKSNNAFPLESLLKKLEITDSVNLYDPVQDIKLQYLDSSIFALSSRFEGFGMVLIEAMACGIPSVSFDCPYGPSDIITNEEDGFLVGLPNVNAFAKKLILLIEHQQLRFSLGLKAKENVKRYLPDQVMPQWQQLFNSLIK